MISVTQARKILSENAERGEILKEPLKQVSGLILAEDIFSPIDVPSFDNSAMDGYAMDFDANTREWELIGVIQAGDTSVTKVEKGYAVRIFTGAKIPHGANTVIPQELIQLDENTVKFYYDHNKITTGSNVRKKGAQCAKGDLIISKGSKITPGIIGLLASVGLAEVHVYTPPSVALIITGDELKEVGAELKEGEIYNSNGPMLEAFLKKTEIRNISAYSAKDEKQELQQIINEALFKHDVLILSGGISVGDYDFVKECLDFARVRELFYKVKQRPGKPFFAGKKEQKWVFALPGNPASVISCYNQYVKPCLTFMLGGEKVWDPDEVLQLEKAHQKKPGLTFFVKAIKESGKVRVLEGQQSFNLQAFASANCLVELKEEEEYFSAGTFVNIYNL